MRGEYLCPGSTGLPHTELPPRARRIPTMLPAFIRPGGTTSACAENTAYWIMAEGPGGNYLRVRGEYPLRDLSPARGSELPPRARRIHKSVPWSPLHRGTTSACAENTSCFCWGAHTKWNYLRVRGEYISILISSWTVRELPPRARRIHAHAQP